MTTNYTLIPEDNFSGGIDSRSAENQIQPSFVRDLLNGDILERRARKRRGYQGYAGNLPVRVTSLEYDVTSGEACFNLDESINLLDIRSTPIIVYGRSSTFTTGQGPFTTSGDTVKYYSSFSNDIRKQLTAPSGTLVIPANEHGLSSTNLFIDVVESTNTANLDNTQISVDAIRINDSTRDISIDYTTSINRSIFVYYADKSTVLGSSYTNVGVSIPGSTTQTISITTGTHGLSNFNIIGQVYSDNGTQRVQITPDAFTVNQSTGQVDVTITNGTSSAITYVVILDAAPAANILQGSIGANTTGSIQITGLTTPFLFDSVYLEMTPGGILQQVIPDSTSYDSTSATETLTFTNSNSTATNFRIFYEPATTRSNRLCVTDASVTVTGTDNAPQLSIWGLDHSEIYGTKINRDGWVNLTDSYRRPGEQRLISGLGGNLFSAREFNESGSQYAYGDLFPRLLGRVASPDIIGPVFWNTGEVPALTRGYITSTDSATHWATVTAVAYNSGTGFTDYTISLPAKAILDSVGAPTTLSSVISTTAGLEDYLTVDQMSYSIHQGTFKIAALADGVDQIVISVVNPKVDSNDFDDSNLGGQAGIFTDKLTLTTTSPFIPADILNSSLFAGVFIITCSSSLGTSVVVTGVTDRLGIATGLEISGERTSSVVPLRDISNSPSVLNMVRGDMLSYSDISRQLRVLYINPENDITVSITSDGEIATVTLGSGTTDFLSLGMNVLLSSAGVYTGVQTVTAIPTASTFQFATSLTTSVAGVVLTGNTIHIDENLDWMDSIGNTEEFRVETRWIPAEAPDDSYNLTPSTHGSYFNSNPYGNQPSLRSTIVANTMYLTNSNDEVMKYDGQNLYRSGLLPWQPSVFLQRDTAPAARIVANLKSVAYSAVNTAQGTLTVATGSETSIAVGTPVRISGASQEYTVTDTSTSATVQLDRSIEVSASASGTINEIGVYRYYFRLNAVDSNNNIVASAVTGSEDNTIDLVADSAIRIRLVGLPAWDIYDYNRLEVQIYRTKINTPAPFYLVTTIQMSFNSNDGYIDYIDSFSDSDLTSNALDTVMSNIKGQELGISLSDPPRAKYITSINNCLVLANLRDYPQLDIQMIADGTADSTFFDTDFLTFRRDETATGTVTDMLDTAVYEWHDSSNSHAISGITGILSTSFSVSAPAHGFTAPGQWAYIYYSTLNNDANSANRPLIYAGWWQIASVTDANNFVVNFSGAESGAAAFFPDRVMYASNRNNIPVNVVTDGNFGSVTSNIFSLFDAAHRMSVAINATMRKVDTSITSMVGFVPWLVARAGNDLTPAGRLVVRQPRSEILTPSVVLSTFSQVQVFVNSVRRTANESISASTRIYPSRIVVSYPNFPEIMDAPTSIVDSDSDSAIDINSADGQEITGVIPFFGEAAFGAAQQSQVLVVFKTNSIYLVDVTQKKTTVNPNLTGMAVQKLQSEGLGCTAPFSIASTKNGIIFANESGIYCLRMTQLMEYLGKFMERNWTTRVDINNLDLVQGHHFGVGRQYKLSVPIIGTAADNGYLENSEVFVYDHTAENQGAVAQYQGYNLGAWSRYDNHPATSWTNLLNNAYFGSTGGRIFIIRQLGDLTDYRDDNKPIDFQLVTRANAFGNSGMRKIVDSINIHYRVGAYTTGTSVGTAIDTEQTYRATTPFNIPKLLPADGISDAVDKDVISIKHFTDRRRGVYIQVQVANNTIDENVEIAGMDFKVGGISDKGILQAKQTQKIAKPGS